LTHAYQDADWKVVDYQIYCLDPDILDRQTQTTLLLRGPKPAHLEKGNYFACIGAAQTFGRFCKKPYPTLLQERLGLPVLNFGRGGAGPSFFSEDNEKLLEYLNGAKFVIIQMMSGRSEGNSLFESRGLGTYVRRSDGTSIGCDQAFKELLETANPSDVKRIVAETRQNWINSYANLLTKIQVPKVLFWFSTRNPRYIERYKNAYTLFGDFPQLVNLSMVNQIKRYGDRYVKYVSQKGMPQVLIDRSTGQPTTVEDEWGGGVWHNNWYYPSPEMHLGAANALERICRRISC
jgi:hypothetical protein